MKELSRSFTPGRAGCASAYLELSAWKQRESTCIRYPHTSSCAYDGSTSLLVVLMVWANHGYMYLAVVIRNVDTIITRVD